MPHVMLKGSSRLPSATGSREGLSSKPIPRSVNKIRSNETLSKEYRQPRTTTITRRRQFSEPIRTLEQQGIVRCEGISMDEAWCRFGIRSTHTPIGVQTVPPISHAINTCSRLSKPSAKKHYGGQWGVGVSKQIKCSEEAPVIGSFISLYQETSIPSISSSVRGSSNAAASVRSRKISQRAVPPTISIGTETVVRQRNPALPTYDARSTHHHLPQRENSATSVSSYGSAQSWVSPTTLSTNSTRSDSLAQTVITKSVVTAVRSCPSTMSMKSYRTPSSNVSRLRQEVKAIPRWRGTRSSKIELQEKQEKEQLQCMLGRPTGSEDSPYSICNLMRRGAKKETPMSGSTIGPSSIPKAPTRNLTMPVKPPRKPTLTTAPSCLKVRNVTISRRNSSESLATSSSESAHSCETTSTTKSVRFVDDEAQKLWRSLENTLGVKLDCETIPEKVKPKPKPTTTTRSTTTATSRIPRLQLREGGIAKKTPLATTKIQQPLLNKRQSRLPVLAKMAQLQWEPKLKRNSSLVSQTLQYLRSTKYESDSDSESHYSISYIGSLPIPEKQRREEAIRRKCWGEQALRIIG